MKIAITSMGDSVGSLISEKFGRAPYFIIYDTETQKSYSIKNDADKLEHGAGPNAVKKIMDEGCDVLLTGNLGGNALSAIKESGIKYFTQIDSSKKVKEVIEEYLARVH
jgi:predicted Fe-Mo cluster-binding NifX family protein